MSSQAKPSQAAGSMLRIWREQKTKKIWTAMETQQWITEQNSNSTHNCTHDCVENPIESDKLVEWCVERVNSNSNGSIGPLSFRAEGLIFYFHSSTSWLPIIFFISPTRASMSRSTHTKTHAHTLSSRSIHMGIQRLYSSQWGPKNPMF